MTPTDALTLRTAVLAAIVRKLERDDLQGINETVAFPDAYNVDENLAAVVALDVVDGQLVITLDVAGKTVRV